MHERAAFLVQCRGGSGVLPALLSVLLYLLYMLYMRRRLSAVQGRGYSGSYARHAQATMLQASGLCSAARAPGQAQQYTRVLTRQGGGGCIGAACARLGAVC